MPKQPKLRAFTTHPLYHVHAFGVVLATSAGKARAQTVRSLQELKYMVPGQIDMPYSFPHVKVKRAPKYDILAQNHPKTNGGYDPAYADFLLQPEQSWLL